MAAVVVISASSLYTWLTWWQKWGVAFTGSRPATCMPDSCFCEAIRAQGLAQPMNTWSCLGFVVCGVAIFFDHTTSLHRGDTQSAISNVQSLLYGAALVLVGFGSAIYHASLTFFGQFVDVFAMYLIVTLLAICELGLIKRLSPTTIILGYIVTNVVLAALLWTHPAARRYMFAALVLMVIVLDLAARRRGVALRAKYFWQAVLVLAIGFAIWIADITRTLCAPYSPLQGHGVWHIAGAIASALMYVYFRQGSPPEEASA